MDTSSAIWCNIFILYTLRDVIEEHFTEVVNNKLEIQVTYL